jgi:hypothetical protein
MKLIVVFKRLTNTFKDVYINYVLQILILCISLNVLVSFSLLYNALFKNLKAHQQNFIFEWGC